MTRQRHAVQVAAHDAARGKRGFNYYMEQGLGKTGTALLEFSDLVQTREATRMVVFCPNSFKKGWVDEAAEWGLDFDFHVYQTGNDWANNAWAKKKYTKPPVLIVNYDVARPKYRKEGKSTKVIITSHLQYVFDFMAGRKVYLAIDESIQIASHDAAQTDGVLLVTEKAEFVRNLSGRPQRKGPHDLWAQLRAIKHMPLNFFIFRNAYCKMGGFKGKQIVGSMNETSLAEIVDPVTFYATKKDWTDLPPKVPMTREYELGNVLAAHYKTMEDEFVVWLNENQNEFVTIQTFLTKYIKLAQIQAGFVFDENKNVRHLVEPGKNPRLNLLETILEDEVPGKSIVVYNHRPMREYILDRFARFNPVFIHGGMGDDVISENKRLFNKNRDTRMICITKAAKYGHTLLGDQSYPEHAAADMIFLENTYNSDDRAQLEDRPHRHGQGQEMVRYWDLIGTPLDKTMVDTLKRNDDVFKAVFGHLKKTGRL